MEDGTALNGQAPPPTEDYSSSEVDVHRKEFFPDASIIANLEAQVGAYERERGEFLLKMEELEGRSKAMDARASSLEGEVARLHRDLVSAMSEGKEATAEASRLRLEIADLGIDKSKSMDARASSIEGDVARLHSDFDSAMSESKEAITGVNQLRLQISDMGKVVSDLEEKLTKEEKDVQIGIKKVQALAGDVEVLQRGMAEMKESGDEPSDGGYLKLLPYAATALSAGFVAAGATACFLRHSRER